MGVSKRCCPVCADLLKISGNRFVFTAAHHTISGCALPEYLPIDIIDHMIKKFGNQLSEELVLFKERTEIQQSCDRSIGSRHLSTDTFVFMNNFPS